MHVYVLFHGEYDDWSTVAVSLDRAPLDAWLAEYESATTSRRVHAWVEPFELGVLPPVADFTPEWATESDEARRARIAAEVAALPDAYFSTGSVGFIIDPVI